MSKPLLIDTDVLIDYLREQPEAVTYIEGLTESLLMSAITAAELYAGVREGEERTKLDAFIKAFELNPIDQEIAVKKNDQTRENRPVEKTEDSSQSKMNLKEEENTRRKNNFEENGRIIVEEYNEDGEIVRKTPPGYVLQNEMA